MAKERLARYRILIVVHTTVVRGERFATVGAEKIFPLAKERRPSLDTIFVALCKLFLGQSFRRVGVWENSLCTTWWLLS